MSLEKRTTKRIAFSKQSDIRARLTLPDGLTSFETRVLNVSTGGLSLAVEKTLHQDLAAETNLLLENVTGEADLSCLKGHTVQIKWILDAASLENIGLGCEFVDLTNECVETIEELLRIKMQT